MSTKKLGIVSGILFALVVAVTPVIAACDLQNPSECTNEQLVALIQGLLGGSSTTPTTGTGTITGIPAGFQFTTNLMQTSTGNDVKYLQILLNADGNTQVAITGAGSPGNETTYFGPATRAAVIKFQNKYASEVLAPYGLTSGTGYFGVSSRTKANAIIAAGTTPGVTLPAGCTSTSGFSPITGERCDSGSTVVLPPGCTSTSGFSPITGQPCSGGTTTPVTGAFSVTLASTNPASGTLIQGQATADLMRFLVSNGTGSEVRVTAVELTRLGVSADATLANVYLFDGAVRLTDAGTVSAGKVTFNDPNGVIVIPANSTKTISVKADIALVTAGQTVGVSVSAITSSTTLTGTLPIAGNIHTIANATLASVAISNVLPSGGTPQTDPIDGVRIWEATFTVSQRNVEFTKLALRQINSIDRADISNFKLLVDGVEIASVPSLDANGYVTFTFNKTLVTGSRNVKVLANVTGGSSRYIQMSLRNKADIDVKDAEYGVNVSVSPNTVTATAIQVNVGAFTITANNAALPVTIANSASSVLIGKWTFKATGEAVKVETLTAGFTYTNSGFVATTTNPDPADPENIASKATCNGTYTDSVSGVSNSSCATPTATLRNGKIMINGAQAGSTATLAQAGTPYTVNYTFQPGVETVVEVYADVYDNDGLGANGGIIVANDKIQAKLVQGADNATKQVSLGVVGVPSSTSEASEIIVSSGQASLVMVPSFGSRSTVLPQTGYQLGSWTLTASTSEDINVNNLSFNMTFAGAGGTAFAITDMADMYATYQIGSSTVVTTSVTPTPTDPNSFSASFTLPKGQTATINLFSSLKAGPGTGRTVQADLTVSGTGAQSGAAANISAGVAGPLITVANAELTIVKDASTPVSTLLVGGNTVKTVSYKIESINDAHSISQMVFGLTGTNGTTAINTVYLKEGVTILSSAPSSATVTFNLPTPITVSANSTKIIDVEVALASIGFGAGATGADVKTELTSVLKRPASTGTAASQSVSGQAGNSMYAYKDIPTISLGTLPSSNLQPGTNTISRFTVSSTGGTTAWNKIIFNVSKSDAAGGDLGAISGIQLWEGSTQILGTAVIVSTSGNLEGVDSASGTITFYPNNEEQVSGSKTYDLRVNVAGTVATGDSITVSIPNTSFTFAASKKAFANVGSLIYADADATNTVTAKDVRKTAVDSYAAVNTASAGNNGTTVLSGYANGVTNASPMFTYTLGTTAWAYTSGDATWTVTATAAGSFTATKNGTTQKIVATGVTQTDGATLTVAITRTAGGYAVGTAVASGNSDLELVLTPGVAGGASFIWSDVSAQSHSNVTEDWTTDFLVKNLPTNTQALQR